MIRYILCAIIVTEVIAIMTAIGKVFLLVYRECKTPRHVPITKNYQASLENARHRDILTNLKETPYIG